MTNKTDPDDLWGHAVIYVQHLLLILLARDLEQSNPKNWLAHVEA